MSILTIDNMDVNRLRENSRETLFPLVPPPISFSVSFSVVLFLSRTIMKDDYLNEYWLGSREMIHTHSHGP